MGNKKPEDGKSSKSAAKTADAVKTARTTDLKSALTKSPVHDADADAQQATGGAVVAFDDEIHAAPDAELLSY